MEETRLPKITTKGLLPTAIAEQLATITTGFTPDPERELQEPSYYDYPVLKAPLWRWEIIWYFFFGGLASGCFVIASIAALLARVKIALWFVPDIISHFCRCYPVQYYLLKILADPNAFCTCYASLKSSLQCQWERGDWSVSRFSVESQQ